ncbi:hypothetical protein [Helicobacter bilis]|uniref:hypothetical protein n=1 Tax=Helicobacter bilis TaxID=37372 RepID=UPI002941D133|nr:hypothetical protein [Helicobacter bilis]
MKTLTFYATRQTNRATGATYYNAMSSHKRNITGLKSALCVFLCQSSFKGELVEFGTIEANKISFISNHKSFKKHNDIQALLKHVKEQEPITCYFEKCINAKNCILLDNKKGE